MSGWPDAAHPGVPASPERDGWHWVRWPKGGEPIAVQWRPGFQSPGWIGWRNSYLAHQFAYLGPCLTPAEVAALAQERYNRATSQRLDAEAFDDLRRENADLKQAVIAFAAPWVVQWARDHGWPEGHLHPDHYDLLARCGARMDDFTRGEVPA